jgi:signal transduction histidine kinase
VLIFMITFWVIYLTKIRVNYQYIYPFFIVAIVAVFANSIRWYFVRFDRQMSTASYLIMVADMLLITAFVYYSGGVESPFKLIYLIQVMGTGFLVSFRGSLACATLSGSFFSILSLLEYFGAIPHFTPGSLREPPALHADPLYIFTTACTLFVSLYVVSFVANYTANRLSFREEELKQKNIELEKVNRRLKELDTMKSDFISTVSHELRTPLTSIKGSLQIFLKNQAHTLGEMQRELLNISLRNTDRLVRLINDILDISKIESGRSEMRFRRINMVNTVEAAVAGIRSFADTSGVSVRVDKPKRPVTMVGDFDRIYQVLTNLLSNAIKFSNRGTRVKLEIDDQDSDVQVNIIDQGRGIDKKDLGRLFKKFQQLDSSDTREVGGTGLGLAICKEIVEAHGGRIWCARTAPGRGSTFSFVVPKELPEEAQKAEAV